MSEIKKHSFTCPACGGHYWGAGDMSDRSKWTANCHDQFRQGCRWSGPYDDHIKNEHLDADFAPPVDNGRTYHCGSCVELQAEVERLKAFKPDHRLPILLKGKEKELTDASNVIWQMEREIAALKQSRLGPIDEAIARVKHIAGGFEKRSYAEDMKAELRGYLQWIDIDLTEIRAKYAGADGGKV